MHEIRLPRSGHRFHSAAYWRNKVFDYSRKAWLWHALRGGQRHCTIGIGNGIAIGIDVGIIALPASIQWRPNMHNFR
jgi:hypothetical protein